jgi:signal transduction histidine kinase
VALRPLVLSSAFLLGHEARRRGATIDTSRVEEVGSVAGSAGNWQTIVFNLILNAVQHAPAGARVQLRLVRDPDAICFEADNPGRPIARELAERLFEPFASAGGVGLGLMLVKRQVEGLSGRLELENGPDRVVFRVRVAALAATPAATEVQ